MGGSGAAYRSGVGAVPTRKRDGLCLEFRSQPGLIERQGIIGPILPRLDLRLDPLIVARA